MRIDLSCLAGDLGDRRIVAFGDVMLDVYTHAVAKGMCREAPVPLVEVHSTVVAPGGAGNTAVNIASLGGAPMIVSATGRDRAGRQLGDALRRRGVDTSGLVVSADRRTIRKRRVVVGNHILMRIDEGSVEPPSSTMSAEIARRLDAAVAEAEAVVVSDHGAGVVTGPLIDHLSAARDRLPVVIDAHDLRPYACVRPSAVTPNYDEAAKLLGLPRHAHGSDRIAQISECGSDLLEVTGADLVVVTMGAEGALLFEAGRPPFHSRGTDPVSQEVIGAGDVFVATLTLALAAGADPPVAVELATRAANVAARRPGTAVCSSDDLVARLGPAGKILAPDSVGHWVESMRRDGHRIVFTNGCFDLVHDGHVAFLSEAKALGDVLIVGVNDDDSVRSLKGTGRPLVDLQGRLALLAAFSCVDRVVAFSGPSPVGLIQQIRPDVYAKGGDYTIESLPEAGLARRLGADVRILTYLVNRSTSRIIERARSS